MNLESLPRPKVELVGQDGNAYAILGRCSKAAKRAGWTKEQVIEFHGEATSGDYDKLLQTVIKYFGEVEEDEGGFECAWCARVVGEHELTYLILDGYCEDCEAELGGE